MDVIFENRYIKTKEVAKEIYIFFYLKKPKLILYVIIGLFFSVDIALYFGNPFDIEMIIVPIIFAMEFNRYSKFVKGMLKSDNETNQQNPMQTNTIVTDEYMRTTTSTGSSNELKYSQVKKVFQTKSLIVLYSYDDILYIFKKDTFTKGTYIEFVDFLIKKGFNL